MLKSNKIWKKLLKKTIKLNPKSSVKNILLKTKKKFRKYNKKLTIKNSYLLIKKYKLGIIFVVMYLYS